MLRHLARGGLWRPTPLTYVRGSDGKRGTEGYRGSEGLLWTMASAAARPMRIQSGIPIPVEALPARCRPGNLGTDGKPGDRRDVHWLREAGAQPLRAQDSAVRRFRTLSVDSSEQRRLYRIAILRCLLTFKLSRWRRRTQFVRSDTLTEYSGLRGTSG